jgi:chorismate mutase-like protein
VPAEHKNKTLMPLLFFRSYLVLLIGFMLPLRLAGQHDRRDEIRARGTLRVGTTGDYQPFSYRANAASPYIGLDVELAGRLARALGVRLVLVPTSWSNLMKDFSAGKFDVAMSGVSITVERQQAALFSIAYLQDGKTPIARCTDQTRFQSLTQIDQPGVRVIVNPGGTNERFARARLRHATVTVWPDNLTIFDRIVTGAADLMITDAIETKLQQKLRPELCAVHPEKPFDSSEKAYLLPRDVRFKSAVDEWLRPLLDSGEFARLLDKWLEHPWPRAAPAAINLEPLCALIAERLAVMPDVARYKWNTRTAIEDLARERQIIEGLKQDAEAFGIPASWAERFFRAQIEAAKMIQRQHFARWEKSGQGPFAEVPDLATVIRPRLDALTPRLLRELAMGWPALSDPAQRERIARVVRQMERNTAGSSAAAVVATAPLMSANGSTAAEK